MEILESSKNTLEMEVTTVNGLKDKVGMCDIRAILIIDNICVGGSIQYSLCG